MKKIHIATPEGQAEYEEAQARTMWEHGKFPPNAKYWTIGMAEWQPLSEYFSTAPSDRNPYAPPTVSDQPQVSADGNYAYTKSPVALTRFVTFMLWLSLGCEVATLLSEVAQYSLLSGTYTQAEGDANDTRQQILALAYLAIFLTTSVPFLRWIHRANLNCRGFGAADMTFTPGWSVGWFFIPFLNLVRPYQAMKEIWQVSHNPPNWKNEPGSPVLKWWWGLWLASGFVGQISYRFSASAHTVEDLKASTVIEIGSHLISIPLCLVALTLIRRISGSQEALVNRN